MGGVVWLMRSGAQVTDCYKKNEIKEVAIRMESLVLDGGGQSLQMKRKNLADRKEQS